MEGIVETIIDLVHEVPNGRKFYNTMYMHRGCWVVNSHDGVKAHPDGSSFYDIHLSSNEREHRRYIKELKKERYVEN